MAQQKKDIARLVLQGISILGILFGISCFFFAIDFIFSFPREDLTDLCVVLIMLIWMLVLGAFFLYPSYKMLRGRSFEVLKSMAALLALSAFGLIMPFAEDLTQSDSQEMSRILEDIIFFASLALSALAFVLVYKVSVKLLNRLQKAAYGPEITSETQDSTDKQST